MAGGLHSKSVPELIHKFHAMESTHRLFDLARAENIPLWDICRYSAYVKYCYPESGRKRLGHVRAHVFADYARLLGHLAAAIWKTLARSGQVLVITCSRFKGSDGRQFDKAAQPLIEVLGRDGMVMEAVLGKTLRYPFIYDFACVFRRVFPQALLRPEYYIEIEQALMVTFGECRLSEAEVAQIYHNFRSDAVYYRLVFRLLGTKRVFIAEGNPKGILRAARDCALASYLLQHGGIEFDEIDFSYPSQVDRSDNIIFPDYVLTLGDYWCKGLNVPAEKVIAIGNDLFFARPAEVTDGSVLVISTIVHGEPLRSLTKDAAALHPAQRFIFKLHPNEYHLQQDYACFFAGCQNVSVVTDQIDISVLVARSDLVLLIVSAVLYEALNQGKKVAVYKRLNFERQKCVSHLKNVHFVDSAEDLSAALVAPSRKVGVDFYKPTDRALLRRIAEGCLESSTAGGSS